MRIPLLTYDAKRRDLFLSIKGVPLVGEQIKLLGEGTYGLVWLFRTVNPDTKEEEELAVKVVPLPLEPPIVMGRNIRESAIISRLSHPLILPIKSILIPDQVKEGSSYQVGLVTPSLSSNLRVFMKGEQESGMLFPSPKRLTEMQKLKYCYQIVAATAYLHSRDVIHRDLKPANTLYDQKSDRMVIADFGLSRALACPYPDKLSQEVFTLWYRPSEVLLDGTYYYPADVWSVGALLYFILSGKDLFTDRREINLLISQLKLLGGRDLPAWPLAQRVVEASDRPGYQDERFLELNTTLQAYSDRFENTQKILALDTENIAWSQLLLSALK
jgi:serine/threonine protein kinase